MLIGITFYKIHNHLESITLCFTQSYISSTRECEPMFEIDIFPSLHRVVYQALNRWVVKLLNLQKGVTDADFERYDFWLLSILGQIMVEDNVHITIPD